MQSKRQKAIQIKYKNKPLKVQSIRFDKNNWNKKTASTWIERNHYHNKKIDSTPASLRFRQINPKHFIQSTYRTKNIGKGISLILAKPENRNYEKEYAKFQKSKKAKKYRAELNRYNHKKGTYGNGDGLDASHKKGKIVGFEASHKNKGRKEKSRLKNE